MPKPNTIVFAVFSDVTQLDFTGPLQVLSRLPGAHCVVASEAGGSLEIGPGMILSNLPRLADLSDCSILCVPGGLGTNEALLDHAFLAQLRRLAAMAHTVTSVCTGSLLLGAAGLLRGKRAACHWALRDQLCAFGAIADPGRVVRDGNVVTGGGVTAGIDMALQLVAEQVGEDFARVLQLVLEYAPAPPFDSGRPEVAWPETVKEALAMVRPLIEGARQSIRMTSEPTNAGA